MKALVLFLSLALTEYSYGFNKDRDIVITEAIALEYEESTDSYQTKLAVGRYIPEADFPADLNYTRCTVELTSTELDVVDAGSYRGSYKLTKKPSLMNKSTTVAFTYDSEDLNILLRCNAHLSAIERIFGYNWAKYFNEANAMHGASFEQTVLLK